MSSPEREAALAELRSATAAGDIEAARAALDRLAALVGPEGPTEDEVAAAVAAVRLCRFGSPPSSVPGAERPKATRRTRRASKLEELALQANPALFEGLGSRKRKEEGEE